MAVCGRTATPKGVRALPLPARVEAVTDLGAAYAVRLQSRWLGWDPALEPELLRWVEDLKPLRAA